MTTGAIADYAIAAKGLDVDSRVRAAIREKCRAALVRLQARGKVRKIVDWPEAWWE